MILLNLYLAEQHVFYCDTKRTETLAILAAIE